MKIAILLTCHNRKDKTIKCIGEIYHQKGIGSVNVKVFLVDDGCTDNTSDTVAQKYPNVHIIKGDGNLYWNRGMLLAWKTALDKDEYDAVIWLNDDTILQDDALEKLIKCYQRHTDSIIVGSTAWTSDHKKLSYGGYNKYNELIKPSIEEMHCKFFNGNIVLVPVSVSSKIGLLDPYFRHAMGDFEYGLRATKKGVSIYLLPIIGYCDRNNTYIKWKDTKYNILKRLDFLYSPLGNNPFEAFYYFKNISYKKAVLVFCYLHIATFIPYLFKKYSTL